MSRTSRTAWKDAERWMAAIFAAKRRPLSGNTSGRDDQDGSDSTHEVLFLEAKLADRYKAVRTLHDACRKRAKGRPVVIGLRSKHRPGGLVVVHSDDLDTMIAQRFIALHGIGGIARMLIQVLIGMGPETLESVACDLKRRDIDTTSEHLPTEHR